MKKIAMLTLGCLLSACSIFPQNSISGIYQGTLPCADCTKIDAKLILNSDRTYQYHTVYYKKKDKYPFIEKGSYIWDPKIAHVIRLTNSNNLALRILDNGLEVCDSEGNPSQSGNKYRLEKVTD